MRITYAAVSALLLAWTVSPAARAQVEWKPSRNVDIIVASANVIPHFQSSKARPIGISATQRQPGALSIVPTLCEHGIDAACWRGHATVTRHGGLHAENEYRTSHRRLV